MRALLAALSLGSATLGCASAAARPPASPDYAVYSTVLDQVLAGAARSAYLVRPQTHGQVMFGVSEMLSQALGRITDAPPSLLADFVERNRSDVPIDPNGFRTRKPVQMTGDPALQRAMDEQKGDEDFPAMAPAHGVITLSRVGYSADGSRAAVHAFFLCGPRCGGGTIVVLERVGRTWIVLAKRETVQY